MNEPLDLIADLNAEDDDGLGWSVLTDARVPEQVRRGALILAGNRARPRRRPRGSGR